MSAYTKRKHVSKEVEEFDDLPTDKSIVKIVCGKGNNLHLVQTDNGEEYLASMPTKFRKYVWVKRGESSVTQQTGRLPSWQSATNRIPEQIA